MTRPDYREPSDLRCDYCGQYVKNPLVTPNNRQTLALDIEYDMICKKCDDQRPKKGTVH